MSKGPRKCLDAENRGRLIFVLVVWEARGNPENPPSLLALRDIHEHLRQRTSWNRAFSAAAMKDYESTISKRVLQLSDGLLKASCKEVSTAVDLTKWFGYFA